MKNKIVPIIAIAATMMAMAEEAPPSCPITSTYNVEIGASRIHDTYMSPLHYEGVRVALSGSWQKMMPANRKHLVMQTDAMLETSFDRNVARSAYMYDFNARFSWGVLYRWQLTERWNIAGGAAAGFSAGAFYLPPNGNNPANAKVDAMISLRAQTNYSLRLWGKNITLTDRVSVPSVGVMFSPEFGESYYEIYLGNRIGLAHAAWWGNHFCIDNHLSASIPLKNKSLTIGYRFALDTQWVNNLKSSRCNHSFTLGLTFGPQIPIVK